MEKQETVKILTKLLKELGIKIDKNTEKTPERIVKAWAEMCRGIGKNKEIKEMLSVEFPSDYTGMITQGPLDIFSLCSHYLLPVEYKVYIGYIPSNKKVLGFFTPPDSPDSAPKPRDDHADKWQFRTT